MVTTVTMATRSRRGLRLLRTVHILEHAEHTAFPSLLTLTDARQFEQKTLNIVTSLLHTRHALTCRLKRVNSFN